jgi:hypothetical protein
MRISTTLAALGALMLAAPSAMADPVRLPFRAEPGLAWKVDRQQTFTGDSSRGSYNTPSSTSATLKVIEASGGGYVMEWTTTSVTGDATTSDGVAPSVLQGMAIRYRTGPGGHPLELVNEEAVITHLLAAMSRHNVFPGSPALAAARKTFEDMPPADLVRHILGDAANIASCQNLTLDPGKPLVSAAIAPPVPNTPPVRLEVVSTLEDAGSARTPARVHIVQTTNHEDLVAGLIAGTKSRLKPGQVIPADAEARLAKFKQVTTIDCTIDRTSGHALAVTIDLAADTGTDIAGKIKDVRRITLTRLP